MLPSVCAPSTSRGAFSVGSYARSCNANNPTWGPLPCVMTTSWPAYSGASAATARLTLARCTSVVIGSPRFKSALPPNAITTRGMSLSQCRDQQRLDRVQAVLGLLERDVRLRLEDIVRDFEAVRDAVLAGDLFADRRF